MRWAPQGSLETLRTHTFFPDPTGSMTRQLQKAAVRVLNEQTCRRFYPVQISSRMLCAGFPQGGVDSCSVSGDRGSLNQCMQARHHHRLLRQEGILLSHLLVLVALGFATPGFSLGFWGLTWVPTLVRQAIFPLSLPKSSPAHLTLRTSHFTTANPTSYRRVQTGPLPSLRPACPNDTYTDVSQYREICALMPATGCKRED